MLNRGCVAGMERFRYCLWPKIGGLHSQHGVCIIVMQLEITTAVFGLFPWDVIADQFHENCFVIFRIDGLPFKHIMGENHPLFVKKSDEHDFKSGFLSVCCLQQTCALFHPLASLLLHLWVILIEPRLVAGYNIVEPGPTLL